MAVLKLWLIEQTENNRYDTYDSAVVAALTEDDARHMHPNGSKWSGDIESGEYEHKKWSYRHSDWAHHPRNVTATIVGNAHQSISEGDVLCASYNAG